VSEGSIIFSGTDDVKSGAGRGVGRAPLLDGDPVGFHAEVRRQVVEANSPLVGRFAMTCGAESSSSMFGRA
jgi:hypothetical protein